MKVTSKGIINGYIQDKYGKRGNQFNEVNSCTYSLPFLIEEFPENTVCFAMVLEDKDAIPVCGFSFIHWSVADLEKNEVSENESIKNIDLIQGVNSEFKSVGVQKASIYIGMAPPDKDHTYEIHVYALDKKTNLKKGFFVNELYKKMEGHIIDSYTLKGIYKK
ncbi:MAG: YbhB/YbcL family Raf kinase inhibitor-like protein [Bacilli bacterium]|nr:YbhB/YbcL family Raf kinase inhibitor-like protein [Bacilli bacterium]